MIPRAAIPLTVLLILALTVPAFAGDSPEKKSRVRNVAGSVYHNVGAAMEQTEGALTNCLKRTFSVFNPCLDLVKGCTGVVLAPIQTPLDYLAARTAKPRPVRAEAKSKPQPKDEGGSEKPEKAE